MWPRRRAQTISDLLVQMKENVVAAMDPSIDTASRTALDSGLQVRVLRQITQVTCRTPTSTCANMLNDSGVPQIKFIANADANGHHHPLRPEA